MAQQHLLGLMLLLACFCLESASRPSNNESPDFLKVEVPVDDQNKHEFNDSNQERSLPDDETLPELEEENTKEILDKIKVINNKLRRPQRQQINYNAPLYAGGPYILDKTILEKIQQIIASGKLNSIKGVQKQQESNSLTNEEDLRKGSPRALRYVQPISSNTLFEQRVALVPLPYVIKVPVVVTPTHGYSTNYDEINSIQPPEQYSTRQRPSLPFQIQWPLAPLFPVLIKDPLLHYLQGGTWETLVDYGQNADVCNRKQKSPRDDSDSEDIKDEIYDDQRLDDPTSINPFNIVNSRQGRKIKSIQKRTVSKTSPLQTINEKSKSSLHKSSQISKSSNSQNLDDLKKLQNFFQKPTTVKPVKKVENIQDTKNTYGDEGNLRFPFGDFTFFGNRRPVAPSPGFFINRLKVRRGGVAIAGPGGVATAGRGGTAVVGPGGLAYTQPGGLAVAGPAARVVALSPDTDLNSVITRLQQQASTDGSVSRLLQAIPEGKVVATGPVVYYHPYNN